MSTLVKPPYGLVVRRPLALALLVPFVSGCSVLGGFAGASAGRYEPWAENRSGMGLTLISGRSAPRKGEIVSVELRDRRVHEGKYVGMRDEMLGIETDFRQYWFPLHEVSRVEIRTGSYTAEGVVLGILVDLAVLNAVCRDRCGTPR